MATEDLALEDSLGDIVAPGDVVAGKYRVERVIGTGGMGVVVEAWHIHFEERVAIKFLFPQMGANEEALGRFEREARAAFKIKSEHVARVIDVGKLEGKAPYMVMEYLEGADVADRLTDREPFVITEAVDFVLQAIEAVAEAHTLGIVHRDLKPENLFITRRADGSVCIKVLDFGLSKIDDGDLPDQRQRALTRNQQVMGTPQYMSPEQWMGAKHVGPASDQWALGVILYELLTGHQPFNQEHIAQLCTQVLRGKPPPVHAMRPEVPSELVAIVDRCLAKQPQDRYPNVAELALALHPFGSPAARESARRIAGIFKRIGQDPGSIPDSGRGGLGHGMVLSPGSGAGARPGSTGPALPGVGQRPSNPRLPKGDEATLVHEMPEEGDGGDAPTAVYQANTVQMSDEARAQFEAMFEEEESATGELPLPEQPSGTGVSRGGTPTAALQTLPLGGPASAEASGRHLVPSSLEESGRHSSPGPIPHAPASAPGTGAAPPPASSPGIAGPQGAGPAGGSPSPGTVAGAPARPQRTVTATAQSWQHMLDESPRDGRKKVVAVFAAIVAMMAIAVFLLVSPGTSPGEEDEAAAHGAEGAPTLPAEEPAEDPIEEPEEPPEEKPAAVEETEDAQEVADEEEGDGEDDSPEPTASAKKKLPPPRPPVKHRVRPRPTIFDHR